MGIWQELNERQNGRSPSRIAVSPKAGFDLTHLYTVESVRLTEALEEGLERVWEDTLSSGLLRQNPPAHPWYAWNYISGFPNIEGVSYASRLDADEDSEFSPEVWEVPPVKYSADYAEFVVTAQFLPRPYAMISDGNMASETVTWYRDTGTPAAAVEVWREWDRNTEWLASPGMEFITADIGQFLYLRSGGGGAAGFPTHLQSAGRGQVKIQVPTVTWNVIWHNVPYRWLTASGSPLQAYRGRVNQKEWEGFRPGTLLYQGAAVEGRPYTQPFPEIVDWGFGAYPSTEKACDLNLTFVEFDVEPFETVTPSNASWIADGHNLITYAKTGRWYYAETRGDAATSVAAEPQYRSYPFQFLFMNPDSAPAP